MLESGETQMNGDLVTWVIRISKDQYVYGSYYNYRQDKEEYPQLEKISNFHLLTNKSKIVHSRFYTLGIFIDE